MFEKITSKDNSNVKLYVKLLKKKHRNEYNLFTLEGLRLVEDAILEGAEIETIFVTDDFLVKMSDDEKSSIFTDEKTSSGIFIITNEIASKLSSTENSQGIFAIAKLPKKPGILEILSGNGKYIFLHNLQDSGNVGTIIRSADAFGITAIFTENCADVFSPKVVRSTMGSIFRLPIIEACYENLFEIAKENGITTFAAVIDKDAVDILKCDFSGASIVIIGNEGNGIPKYVSDICDVKTTINMKGNVNSLNAATAAGIFIWELTK